MQARKQHEHYGNIHRSVVLAMPRALGIGLGMCFGVSAGSTAPTPLLDWRMPATVTTSAGISGSQSALAAGQATAASKSRPSFTVAISGTEYVEYEVAEAGTVLLSWLGAFGNSTVTVTLNGVDQSYTPRFPSGGSVAGGTVMSNNGGRRQFMKLDVAEGDAVRLTVAAGTTERIVRPLLHSIPESRPWEAYVIFGNSREHDGMACKLIEDAIIADDATRDPVFFSYADPGAALSTIADHVTNNISDYVGAAYYVFLGGITGQDITANRPYTSGQKAAIDAEYAQIMAAVLDDFTVLWGNTSYRQYTGITADDQTGGALEYNDEVTHPAVLAYTPELYNVPLARPYMDSYLTVLRWRAFLTDDRHGAYTQQNTEYVRSIFKYVKNGSWAGIVTFPELLVSTAETDSTVEANALTSYTEATYAMLALASTAEKTSMEARLAAIYARALFFEAKRLITAAETSLLQADKDLAQDALDLADSEGFVDMASPNTIAEQQARIDAIVVNAYDQTVKVGFGSNTAVATWNRTASIATGVIFASLLDDAGAATGIGINVTSAAGLTVTNTGLTSALPAVPSAILTNSWSKNGTIAYTITGLDPARLYDIFLMPSRSGSNDGRTTTYTVNGVSRTPVIQPMGNVGATSSGYVDLTNISPNGSGEITVSSANTGSFGYQTVLIIRRRV